MKNFTISLEDDEIAVAIEGYEGRYIVTSLGRVFSMVQSGKWLKGCPTQDGYLQVGLCDGHSKKKFTIHRLVAKSFKIPGWDDPNLEVDHINDDITDNRLVNLQMLPKDKNLAKRDREKMSRSAKLARRNSKYERTRSKPIICIESNEFYWSANEASRAIGKGNGGASNISECCRGLRRSAYGFTWRYATEEEIAHHQQQRNSPLLNN